MGMFGHALVTLLVTTFPPQQALRCAEWKRRSLAPHPVRGELSWYRLELYRGAGFNQISRNLIDGRGWVRRHVGSMERPADTD